MVESAPRLALLRTGETGLNANTTECLGYGEAKNWRWRQLQQREKVTKTGVGSPGNAFPTGFSMGWRQKPLDSADLNRFRTGESAPSALSTWVPSCAPVCI